MKQYTVAYTDNYHVIEVVDGKIVSDNIVAYDDLTGYTAALEAHGYTKAYFVPKYKKEMEKARAAHLLAQENYDFALDNALSISDAEASKSKVLAPHLLKEDYDEYQ
jgi:hypothetical protein